MKQRISQAAFDLIIRFEVGGGRTYYDRRLKHPDWPGGSSGVTIGIGYDLGYEKNLDRDWGRYLGSGELERLARCIGKTGSTAKQALSGVRDISIEWDWALNVFNDNTLPQEIRKTLSTYPGSADNLPEDAFGGLVSLIFNRGTDLTGERRREMLAIKTIVAAPGSQGFRCVEIAKQLRAMKRLWTDYPDSDGDLVDRREAEAKLIESAV